MITIHTAMYIDYINVHVGIEPTFYQGFREKILNPCFYHIHPSEQIKGGYSY